MPMKAKGAQQASAHGLFFGLLVCVNGEHGLCGIYVDLHAADGN